MTKLSFVLFFLAASLTGCRTVDSTEAVSQVVPRFFLESSDPRAMTIRLPQSGVQVAISPKPVFTEHDLTGVDLAQVELGKCLLFQLTPAAGRDLYRMSGSNQGRRLVLLVDGQPVGARRMDGPLTGGMIFIFDELPDDRLAGLVTELKTNLARLQRAAARKT